MDAIFNITNLKGLITFVHLAGLAIGVGGAWVLDAYIFKNRAVTITHDIYQIIEFIAKFVTVGLALIWISGFLFLAYYYQFTPDFLENQKVWGKVFIVVVLTINGCFVHSVILPKIKGIIDTAAISSFPKRETSLLTLIGTVSFVSWVFPIALGVATALNFTTPALDIIGFYMITLLISVLIAKVISNYIFPTPASV